MQESDGSAKDERIHRLLEKNLEAVVDTADGGKQRIATRKQRMQIKSLVAPIQPNGLGGGGGGHRDGPAAPTQRQYDLLKMADARVQQLDTECNGLKDDKIAVSTQLQTLQAQVQRREDEIERLGRLLEGGRPAASVRADGESKREERRLAQLANQVCSKATAKACQRSRTRKSLPTPPLIVPPHPRTRVVPGGLFAANNKGARGRTLLVDCRERRAVPQGMPLAFLLCLIVRDRCALVSLAV
jgi:hypothetical protein